MLPALPMPFTVLTRASRILLSMSHHTALAKLEQEMSGWATSRYLGPGDKRIVSKIGRSRVECLCPRVEHVVVVLREAA